MLTVTLLLLAFAAAGFFLLRRYASHLPLPAGTAPRRPKVAADEAAEPVRAFAAAGTDGLPAASFLPPELEADELEAEDLQWLLARQRAVLEKEERAHLQRESAARLDTVSEQLDALSYRLEALQGRMSGWKEALLRREALELAYEQLRNEHLDQQYGMDGLRAENERLQLALAEARKEAIAEWEETERLRKQLALLRNLTREEGFE